MNELQKRIDELKGQINEFRIKASSDKEEDLLHKTYNGFLIPLEAELKGIEFAKGEFKKMIDKCPTYRYSKDSPLWKYGLIEKDFLKKQLEEKRE